MASPQLVNGVRDPVSGRHINADLAGYHIAAHADIPDVEADFVPDYEPGDPSGIKGVGEVGTVGTAAAIANAVWHATGTGQRTLPNDPRYGPEDGRPVLRCVPVGGRQDSALRLLSVGDGDPESAWRTA